MHDVAGGGEGRRGDETRFYEKRRSANRGARVGWRPVHARTPLAPVSDRSPDCKPAPSGVRVEPTGPALCYRALGAHPMALKGTAGTRFAVWAPNATEVSVLCDANGWTPGELPLSGSDSGIWSGFFPGIGHGAVYKYAVRTRYGRLLEKADPLAFAAEPPPRTASIVYNLGGYRWGDGAWMARRRETDWHRQPVAVYEVHLGSWRRPRDGRRFFNYRELAPMLVDYAKEMGYTHLQLMPITEYPFDGSWGYQVTGYFAPTSRYGTPHDFMYFVDYCHRSGIGVLIDWVPAHFPADGHSLARFDGTALYEHADPRQGFHPDWGTYIFNYGRTEVRSFLLSSARFWLDMYHVDGIRVDAVASMLYLDYSRKRGEWIPNPYGGRENLEAIQFLKDMNAELHGSFPGILTIAEESTAWGGVSRPVHHGGLGFNMKWDMGWMNDTLRYLHRDPVHRSHHQNELSFRMMYAFTENFVLPLSHDEVVHGKRSLLSQMPGDYWQRFANLRLLYGYQYAMPGKKLLFMGGELGQWHEWNHDAELDWPLLEHRHHAGLRQYLCDLNRLYSELPELHQGDFEPDGFRWIDCDDWHNSAYSFERRAAYRTSTPASRSSRGAPHSTAAGRTVASEFVIVALNFTPVPRGGYRLGVPQPGFYREIFNSDAERYGGGNVGNHGGVYSEPAGHHGQPHSICITLPPLAMTVFKL